MWLRATEGLGGLVAGGMRLKPLGGQPLGFGDLCAASGHRLRMTAVPLRQARVSAGYWSPDLWGVLH